MEWWKKRGVLTSLDVETFVAELIPKETYTRIMVSQLY
jgi:hypothetical protein